jgi:hypothetical protein
MLRRVLERVVAAPSSAINPQPVAAFVNRATAGTCAGCHDLASGDPIRIEPDGTPVPWPAAFRFVHVREDRALSVALEEHFLPVRRYILARFLCPGAPPPPAAAAVAFEESLGIAEERPARSADSMRFVDAVVAAFVGETAAPDAAVPAGAATAEAAAEAAAVAADELDPAARETLRQKVSDLIAEARRVELAQPGAFVEVRRPH